MNKTGRWAALGLTLVLIAAFVRSPALAYEWTPYGVTVSVGVMLAMLVLCALRQKEGGAASIGVIGGGKAEDALFAAGRGSVAELALVCTACALVFARLSYCLVRFEFYFAEMGLLSVLKIQEGGFLLYGAVLGALGGAVWLAHHRGGSAADTLDELAAPGLVAVAAARLGEWTTGEGLGAWIESEALMRLPFAVMNEYEEWQLAVFLFEAAVALILLVPVLREKRGEGRRMETALLLYACCQIVLESLRMDSCLKIGFVRVSQVMSAVVILAVTMLRGFRFGGRKAMLCRAVPVALCTAVIGGLEWALDKTPVNNMLLYAVMIAACAAMAVNGMRFAGAKRHGSND